MSDEAPDDLEEEMIQQAIAASLQPAPQAQQPPQAAPALTQTALAAALASAGHWQAQAGAQAGQAGVAAAPLAGPWGGSAQLPRSTVPARESRPTLSSPREAPSWTRELRGWLRQPEKPALAPVELPAALESALQAAAGAALGAEVALVKGGGAPGHRAPRGAVALQLLPKSGSGDWQISDAAVDHALRQRTAPAALRGACAVEVLSGVHGRADAALKPSGSPAKDLAAPVAAVVARVRARAVVRAMEAMAAGAGNEDDLFYEAGGHATQQLLAALAERRVQPAFLEAMAAAWDGTPRVQKAWGAVVRQAVAAVARTGLEEFPGVWNARLTALDVLLQPPLLQVLMAAMMMEEATVYAAAKQEGVALSAEESSFFLPLLSVSPLPDFPLAAATGQVRSPARGVFAALRGYPERRGEVPGAQRSVAATLQQCGRAAHALCERVIKVKLMAGCREAVLAYLWALVGLNERRTAGGEKGVLNREATSGCSDGLAVGATALCLRFCRPFLGGEDKFMARLDPAFYRQQAFRLGGANKEATLAGRGEEDEAETAAPAGLPFIALDRDAGAAAHFVAECFFLTQRAVHNLLMPTMNRYEEVFQLMLKRAKFAEEDGDEGDGPPLPTDALLLQDLTLTQLADPDFAADAVRFVVLEMQWLLRLIRGATGDARAALAAVPESVVRDAAGWLTFVIRWGHADLLGGCDIGGLVQALTSMLERPDLVRSPIALSKMVELLQAMLSPQLEPRRRALGGALGPSLMRPGERALVAAVLGTGAAVERLGPALMRAHAAADHVVGLDVDRDDFDKFAYRSRIDSLLMELWNDEGCLRKLTQLAAGTGGEGLDEVFSDYVGAVLNGLIYLLEDCFDRLRDIRLIEDSKADAAAWAALPPQQRAEKERFYRGQQSTTRGFMGMALQALSVLTRLAADPAIQEAFLRPPLVEEPEQYGFHPDRLLLRMSELLLRLAQGPAFVAAVAEEPDYDEGILRRVRACLLQKQLGEFGVAMRLEALVQQVAAKRGGAGAGASAPSPMEGVEGASGAAEAGQALILDMGLEEPEPADVEARYVAELGPLQVDDWDSTAPGAYNRVYAGKAAEAAGDTRKKMRRLAQELRALQGAQGLPLQAAAAILLRHDGDRPDKMRALITGPEDTPYFGGCFVFDIYCPPEYPAVPPLMTLETTGAGRARYNPNLYADGKVCLSLLGTWHGTDDSQKWHPDSANLWRVLVSIQGMILIGDPYFNEPNVEGMRGSREGDKASRRYNSQLALHTLRFAINGNLRSPPAGFEDAVRTHFRLLRWRILRQVRRWVEDAAATGVDPQVQRRLAEEAAVARGLLAAL
ncbi:hypothetical protein WJX81_004216 [Elliptochloris bilobata]|uniref:UBC core domain-containing protein n=1 Tax=Elliptochloris bilobata TaxID=381761 RepID=A0AAW1S077_9CHLO